jgi:hypothetical protein
MSSSVIPRDASRARWREDEMIAPASMGDWIQAMLVVAFSAGAALAFSRTLRGQS